MPLKFVTNVIETTTENATIGALTTTLDEIPTTVKFIPEAVTDYTGSGVATGFSLKFTDGTTYDLDEILFNIRRDNPESPLAMHVITAESEEEQILAAAISELLAEYSPTTVYRATLTSGSTSVTLTSGDTSLLIPGLLVQKGTTVSVGSQWFDETTNKLYTATLTGSWDDATEEVIPTTQPTANGTTAPAVGDLWFNETTNILYTAKTAGTWDGASVKSLPVSQPTPLDSSGSFGVGSRVSTINSSSSFTSSLPHTASGEVEFKLVLDNISLIPNSSTLISERYQEKLAEADAIESSTTEEGSLTINSNQPKISVSRADMLKYLTDTTTPRRQSPVVNLNRPLVTWTEINGDLNTDEDFQTFQDLNNLVSQLEDEISTLEEEKAALQAQIDELT